MTPTVGRVVHYVAFGTPGGEYPSTDRAAVVTEVDEPDNEQSPVGLAVLNPTGMFFNQHVPFGTKGGQWHWPARQIEARTLEIRPDQDRGTDGPYFDGSS